MAQLIDHLIRVHHLGTAALKNAHYRGLNYAVALHFSYYNFCRKHQSLKGQSPAMAAGVADHVWEIDELVALLEAAESSQKSN